MIFCPPNQTFSPQWINNGLTHCFLDTSTSGILFVFVSIFGLVQFLYYLGAAFPVPTYLRSKSHLFKLQILFTILVPTIPLSQLILKYTFYEDTATYIYEILTWCFSTLAWSVSLSLLVLERRKSVDTNNRRRHGIVLILFWIWAFVSENLAFISYSSPDWFFGLESTRDRIEFGFWVGRYVLTFFLLLLGFKAAGLNTSPSGVNVDAEDGTVDVPQDQILVSEIREQSGSTWADVLRKLAKIWPYVWPKKSIFLQCRVIVCLLLLAAGRGINVLVPVYYKNIVDSLSNETAERTFEPNNVSGSHRIDFILIWVLLRFLQGGGSGTMGVLNNLRAFLWIRVQQYTTREIELRLFNHLHSLSLRWHLGRKTGEVLRIMDRGTLSVNNLLGYIVFNILPTIVDIVIAIVYFVTAFNIYFGIIVFVAMALYVAATIAVTEWRTKFRRKMNILDNERNAKGVDSLLNFETVKYYGSADFESERYDKAILTYQDAEWLSTATFNLLSTIQNLIITAGLAAGSLLCTWYVLSGEPVFGHVYTVGDFVLFATYIVQLYGPLNWFGSYYRMIQQAFVDMENMFDLLNQKQEVKDIRAAPDLMITSGTIEFSHVSFHYEPSRPILKDVSFLVAPGQTFALVGHTGSGKSTVIRLLFRFYDLQEGVIRIDGQDISKAGVQLNFSRGQNSEIRSAQVSQESLRKAIGVVPQDTVLFNNDIRYNIRYGRVTAEDEEVDDAARYADIHDRILTFPDGYKTLVGERGLKLSGGEKQRVAIARTILKAPSIVLMDEATSSLDTKTERNIQAALSKVCENRTSIIVAHRLSTIINADQILVMKEGSIVERGTHEELLQSGGEYFSMWEQQMVKSDDEESGSWGSSCREKSLELEDAGKTEQNKETSI